MKFLIDVLKHLVVAAFFCSFCTILPIVVGSETSVALEPLINFPAADTDNTLLGYGWFKNGFTLEDQNTTATFDAVFPISGLVALNGGTLVLKQDLHFSNVLTFSTSGRIVGNGHTTDFPTSITDFPSGENVFEDAVIFLSNDIALTSTLVFRGTNILNCNGHTFDLNTGNIVVDSGSSLRIIDATLKNIAGNNVHCVDSSSVLILDNLSWWQSGDLLFDQGAFQIRNDVSFEGEHMLIYQTSQASNILAAASLTLETGFTFSYDTSNPSLLTFADETAILVLNDATLHATLPGLNLVQGTLEVNGNSFIAVEKNDVTDNGITLGDCASSSNDFTVHINSGTVLELSQGTLNYKNLNLSSWIMDNDTSVLFIFDTNTLNLYQTLDLGAGGAIFGMDTFLGFAPDKTILGGITQEGGLTFTELPSC